MHSHTVSGVGCQGCDSVAGPVDVYWLHVSVGVVRVVIDGVRRVGEVGVVDGRRGAVRGWD